MAISKFFLGDKKQPSDKTGADSKDRDQQAVGMAGVSELTVLEPRLMFDGAGVATVAEATPHADPAVDTAPQHDSPPPASTAESATNHNAAAGSKAGDANAREASPVSGANPAAAQTATTHAELEQAADDLDSEAQASATDTASGNTGSGNSGDSSHQQEPVDVAAPSTPATADSGAAANPVAADTATQAAQPAATDAPSPAETPIAGRVAASGSPDAHRPAQTHHAATPAPAHRNAVESHDDSAQQAQPSVPVAVTTDSQPGDTEAATAADSQDDTGQAVDNSVEPMAVDAATPDEVTEVIFIDGSVEDSGALLDGILQDRAPAPEPVSEHPGQPSAAPADTAEQPANTDDFVVNGVRVVVLDPAGDELQQITDTLAQYTGLAGVHIISHGGNGAVKLGNTTLNSASLDRYAGELAQWGDALNADGDLLLYGCDVAEDGAGLDFVQSVAQITGADVAASDDATGNADAGGDWDLEVSTGRIDVATLRDASGAWDGVLAPPDPLSDASASDTRPMLNSLVEFSVAFDNDAASDDADEGYAPYVDVVVPAGLDVQAGPTVYGASAIFQAFTWDGANWVDDSGAPVSAHPYDSNGVTLTVPTANDVGDTWYLVDLPFGSFVRDQPPADVVFTANVSVADGAEVDVPLDVVSRAGFRYGDTATNDNGPIEQGTTDTVSITPRVIDIEKDSDAPERQTVTGPNYPVEYTLRVNIAAGETVDNVVVTDVLPEGAVYRGDVTIAPVNGAPAIAAPSINAPAEFTVLGANPADRQLQIGLGDITGVASTASATGEYVITYTVYFSDVDADGNPLLNPTTGDDRNALNESRISGDYNGNTVTDGDDAPLGGLNDDASDGITPSDHQIELNSVDVFKDATVINGGQGVPGDVIEWRIEVDVSDYFGVGNVVLDDVFHDGQTFIDGVNAAHADQMVPTIEIWENGVHTATTAFDAANYTVGVEDAASTTGDTDLQFRVSDQLVSMGQDGFLDGDVFAGDGSDTGATASGDPLNGRLNGESTRVYVVYRTVIDETFDELHSVANGGTGDSSVDIDDTLANDVTVTADILDNAVDHNTVGTEDDASEASVTVPGATVDKSIYAINGDTGYDLSNGVSSGDRVTYRLRMEVPIADFENLTVNDFLPLPVYDADEITNASPDFDGTVSFTGGEVEFGPDHSLTGGLVPGLQHNGTAVPNGVSVTPVISVDSASNRMTLDFGTYDSDNTAAGYPNTVVVDVLVTVTIQNAPMVDDLLLTNQSEWSTNDSVNDQVAHDDIVQITLNEPEVNISKGVVATDNPAGVLAGSQGPAGLTFNADGTISVAAGNPVEAADLEASPVDADLSAVDGGDLVTFGITVSNTGGADVHEVSITDNKPAGFVIPATGLNLRVYDGTGTLLTEGVDYTVPGGDFFANGIDFDNVVLGGNPADRGHDNGADVFIVTYQLELAQAVDYASGQINTATVDFYTGAEDGVVDWTDTLGEPSDDATVTIADPSVVKDLVTTEIVDATNASDEAVIGEEVVYQVTITLSESTVADFSLMDTLDPGLRFVGLDSVTASSGDIVSSLGAINTANITTTVNGQNVRFDFGDLANNNTDNSTPETITLTYRAVVENVNSNQSGQTLDNTASAAAGGVAISVPDAADAVTIIEPDLTISKDVTVDGGGSTGDAGDSVTYTITVQHSASSETDAFDAMISDQIPAAISGASIASVTDTAGTLGAGDFTIDGSNALSNNTPIDIPEGRVITITITGTLAGTVDAGELVANTARVDWQSLNAGHLHDGSADERSGAGGVNNYSSSDPANITIRSPQISKTLIDTEISNDGGAADTANDQAGVNERLEAVIGEEATYQITVTVPEGELPSAVINDTLDEGLALVAGSVSVVTSGGALTVPSQAVSTSGTGNSGDPQTLSIDLGDVVNTDTDNSTAETITITYTAVVINDSANQSGQTLDNSATISWTANGSPRESGPAHAESITVIEPQLDVNKSVVVGAAGNTGDAGDPVTYTITVQHSGSSETDAFDALISDQIPSQISGATITSVTDSAGVLGAADFNINAANLLNTNSPIDIPVGRTITIEITGTLNVSVSPGSMIDNTAEVTWQSLDDTHHQDGVIERTGDGGVNDYQTGNTATIDISPVSISKTLVDTSISNDAQNPNLIDEAGVNERLEAVIGEEVTYQVTITVPEGTMTGAQLVDTLDAGLGFVAVDSITTSSGDLNSTIGPITATNVGTTVNGQTVTFDFGDILINGGNNNGVETITVVYRAVVLNDGANQSADTRSNSASFEWDNGASSAAPASAEAVTIIEPELSITKTVTDGASGNVGDPVEYTLTIEHTANSETDAFDVSVVDNLPAEFANATISSVTGAGLDVADFEISGGALQVAGGATVDILYGQTVTIVLSGEIGAAATPNSNVTNTANVQWQSIDGDDANERTGDGNGPNDYNDSNAADFHVEQVDLSLDKTVTPLHPDVGDTVTFTIVVHNDGPDDATGVSVGDNMPVGFSDPVATGAFAGNATLGASSTGGVGEPVYSIDWDNLSIAANSSITLTFTATVDAPVGMAGEYLNSARVTAQDQADLDSTPGNDDASEDDQDTALVSPTGSIGDTIFHDVDGDGLPGAGEGLGGVDVTLTGTDVDGNPVNVTITTNPDGSYLFDHVVAGDYTVTVDENTLPATLQGDNTVDPDGGLDSTSAVTLGVGEDNPDQDFGYADNDRGSIGDTVFVDLNNDGAFQAGEGLAGITVTLTGTDIDGNAVNLTTTTAGDGQYLFNDLAEGSYTVTVNEADLPADLQGDNTVDPDGGNDSTSAVTLSQAGTLNDLNQDFGYQPDVDLNLVKSVDVQHPDVGDTVTFTLVLTNETSLTTATGVAIEDIVPAGFSGISNISNGGTVTGNTISWSGLSVANGAPLTLTFDAVVDAPTGAADEYLNSAQITAADQADPDSTPGNDDASEDDQDTALVSPTGSIGDTIFHDVDGDGLPGAGEGLGGVTVTLSGTDVDGNTVTATTVTNADGSYLFDDLVEGDYTVTVDDNTLPPSLRGDNSVDPDGGLDGQSSVTLAPGVDDLDQDFGYVDNDTGSIGDHVFRDLDGDGVADPGEQIANVTVTLTGTDIDGNPVTLTTQTGADGAYLFPDLTAGTYTISVDETTLPPSLQGDNVFDPDGDNDSSSTITLAENENNLDQDFGYLDDDLGSIGDTVFEDRNHNGSADNGEGIAGVTVTLTGTDLDGNPVSITVETDANGQYLFEDIPGGSYVVTVDETTLPASLRGHNTVDPDGGNNSSAVIELTAGDSNLDQDFGYQAPPPAPPRPVGVHHGGVSHGGRPSPEPAPDEGPFPAVDQNVLSGPGHRGGLELAGINPHDTRNFGDMVNQRIEPQHRMIGIDPDGNWRYGDEWYYGTEIHQYIHLTVTDQWEKIEAQYGNSRQDNVVSYADGRPGLLRHVNGEQQQRAERVLGSAVASRVSSVPQHVAALDPELDRLQSSLEAFNAEADAGLEKAGDGRLVRQLNAMDSLTVARQELVAALDQMSLD